MNKNLREFYQVKLENGDTLGDFLDKNCLILMENERASMEKIVRENELDIEILKYEFEKFLQENEIQYDSVKLELKGDPECGSMYTDVFLTARGNDLKKWYKTNCNTKFWNIMKENFDDIINENIITTYD